MRFKELPGKRAVAACISDFRNSTGVEARGTFLQKKDSIYKINKKKFILVYIGNTLMHFLIFLPRPVK